jgi:hypothetical protein
MILWPRLWQKSAISRRAAKLGYRWNSYRIPPRFSLFYSRLVIIAGELFWTAQFESSS